MIIEIKFCNPVIFLLLSKMIQTFEFTEYVLNRNSISVMFSDDFSEGLKITENFLIIL